MSDETLDAHLGVDAGLQEVMTCAGHVTAMLAKVTVYIEVGCPVHAPLIASLRVFQVRLACHRLVSTSFFLLHTHPSTFLDCIAFLVLRLTHFIQHVGRLTYLASEEHQRVLVEVLDVTIASGH